MSALLWVPQAMAASFSVTGNDSSAKTLSSGQTGTVSSSGNLSVSGSTVTVTATGASTITNSGTINQTGTGRAIRDNTGGFLLTVTNNATGLIQAADADAIQMNKTNSSISLDNYGSIISLNASAGGAQALDFGAVTTGANAVRNYAGGLIKATGADAIRPGVNGTINNAGTITAIPVLDTGTASSSDGIDAQGNIGIQVTNTGTISGRHGITGGSNDAGQVDNFTITITNNAGGIITGVNGSGINIDGSTTSASVVSFTTVINNGTITGNYDSSKYSSGDGDGVDVDGRIDLTNNGIIRAYGSDGLSSAAEGVSIGGGTIVNNAGAEITGQNNSGTSAEGHGILVDDSNGGNAFAVATITNGGLIRGFSGYGIKMIGTFNDTITNNATGTIRGAGTGAAIQMGAGNDQLTNRGAIIGDNGAAIDLGDGDDTLKIEGGSASISGSITGGIGTNTLTTDPGAGNSFSYAGQLSNFSSAEIKSGTVNLSGASTYAGNTTITAGTLAVTNTTGSATGTGNVIVKNLAILTGTGRIGGSVTLENGGILAPGTGAGELKIDGGLSLTSGSKFVFELGGASSDRVTVASALTLTGGGTVVFDIANVGIVAGQDYTLLTFASQSGLSLSNLGFGTTPSGFSGTFGLTGTSITVHVNAVPEPSTLMLAGLAAPGLLLRRRRRAKTATA